MKDSLGRTISIGDIFLIPGGNPRYGGLHLEIGIIEAITEKRIKTIVTKLAGDKHAFKKSSRTSTKILVIDDPILSSLDVVNTLKQMVFPNESSETY